MAQVIRGSWRRDSFLGFQQSHQPQQHPKGITTSIPVQESPCPWDIPGKEKERTEQCCPKWEQQGWGWSCWALLVDLGSDTAVLAKGRGCFEDVFHACRPSCCQKNKP